MSYTKKQLEEVATQELLNRQAAEQFAAIYNLIQDCLGQTENKIIINEREEEQNK